MRVYEGRDSNEYTDDATTWKNARALIIIWRTVRVQYANNNSHVTGVGRTVLLSTLRLASDTSERVATTGRVDSITLFRVTPFARADRF